MRQSYDSLQQGSDSFGGVLFDYELFDYSWDIPIYDGIVLTISMESKLVSHLFFS